MNNHATAETQQFVGALQQIRRDPGSVIDFIDNTGKFPISCRMRRFETAPPRKADLETDAEPDEPVSKPTVRVQAASPDEPLVPVEKPKEGTTSPDKHAEPPTEPLKPPSDAAKSDSNPPR